MMMALHGRDRSWRDPALLRQIAQRVLKIKEIASKTTDLHFQLPISNLGAKYSSMSLSAFQNSLFPQFLSPTICIETHTIGVYNVRMEAMNWCEAMGKWKWRECEKGEQKSMRCLCSTAHISMKDYEYDSA